MSPAFTEKRRELPGFARRRLDALRLVRRDERAAQIEELLRESARREVLRKPRGRSRRTTSACSPAIGWPKPTEMPACRVLYSAN